MGVQLVSRRGFVLRFRTGASRKCKQVIAKLRAHSKAPLTNRRGKSRPSNYRSRVRFERDPGLTARAKTFPPKSDKAGVVAAAESAKTTVKDIERIEL